MHLVIPIIKFDLVWGSILLSRSLLSSYLNIDTLVPWLGGTLGNFVTYPTLIGVLSRLITDGVRPSLTDGTSRP